MTIRGRKYAVEIFTIIFAAIVSIPLYLVAINSLKSHEEIVRKPLALPHFTVGFSNITRAFEKMDIVKSYSTTLSIVVLVIACGVLLSMLAAYAVSRINQRPFKVMYWVFLSGILVPIQSAMIPLIFILKTFHLNNTLLGIALVYTAIVSPFAIFVFSGFMRTIPRELEEAAFMDGSSLVNTFFRIILPLIKPVTATIIILQFMYVWNDMLLPLVLLNSQDHPTVSIALYKFFGARGAADLSLLFGGISLALLPVIILFLSLQRYFVKGLVAGAVKG